MVWLRTLIFALTFVATVLVLIPRWILEAGGPAAIGDGPGRYLGPPLIALGVILMVWCWGAFAVRGGGTPAPFDPPRRLVVAGPYRWVRNPMYIAALLVLLGQGVIFEARQLFLYAVAFLVVTHLVVVLYEERTLARRFGAEYAEYRAAVGRWIPRSLTPYQP